MSAIKYPETFAGEQTLLKAILAQNLSLGTKSPLAVLFKTQNIDLKTLQDSIGAAATQNTDSGSLKRESEAETEHRNLALETPWAHLLGEVQFLKHLNAGKERDLYEWGITIDGKSRVVLPTGVAAKVDLIQTVIAHHKSFAPGESPLQWYLDENEIDVDADLQSAADALTEEADRNATTGDGQLATQQRNKIWAPSVKAMHLIGAFLMHLYHEDSRKMAAWGFVVVEDGGGTREQISSIDPLSSKEIKSIKIPSILKNIGTEAVQITKGKDAKAITTTVPPGGELGMTKGYSRITVTNPSALAIAKIQVTVSK
jgi:hypothetical protein